MEWSLFCLRRSTSPPPIRGRCPFAGGAHLRAIFFLWIPQDCGIVERLQTLAKARTLDARMAKAKPNTAKPSDMSNKDAVGIDSTTHVAAAEEVVGKASIPSAAAVGASAQPTLAGNNLAGKKKAVTPEPEEQELGRASGGNGVADADANEEKIHPSPASKDDTKLLADPSGSSLHSYKLSIPNEASSSKGVEYTQSAKEFFDENNGWFKEHGYDKIEYIDPSQWDKAKISVTLLKHIIKMKWLEEDDEKLRAEEDKEDSEESDEEDDDDASVDHEFDFTNNRGQIANYLQMNNGTLAGMYKNTKLEWDEVKQKMKDDNPLAGVVSMKEELDARQHTVRT